MTTLQKKQINLLIITAFIALVVIVLSPLGNKLLKETRTQAYIYGYSLPKNIVAEDTSKLPPAQAVPILMYHGVIEKGVLGNNTERTVFISQMEMLKRKGYETISVQEYDLFREGKFTLPPKPVIITFDDGRKDSFYTVDEVLRKLGFKATIFVSTVKANIQENFYLSWDELARVLATGRWEIESHGRNSHDDIQIDEKGTLGTYLTSRLYIPGKGLESVEEYKKRVEDDYVNGIADLKEHLGVDAQYFAVPLNDYGDYGVSRGEDEYKLNQELTRRFFRLAFIQAQQQDGAVLESFYNYYDSSPYISLKRLEVKNISSDNLLQSLERFYPRPPALIFPGAGETESFLQNTQLLYGKIEIDKGITLISSASTPSARILFGDKGWKNYSFNARVVREKGRSVSIIVYYADENNFTSLDWGDKSLTLTERVDGIDRELASYYPWEKEGEVEILVRVRNGYVSAYFSGIVLTQGLPIKLSRGAAGFSVWGPEGARSTIKKLEIVSFDK